MSSALFFMFMLWLVPGLYTAVLTFFCKKTGRSVRPYTMLLILLNVVFLVYSMNPATAVALFSAVTGSNSVEAAGLYSAYLLLIFNGALLGTGLGFLLWKRKYDKPVPVQGKIKGKNKTKGKQK